MSTALCLITSVLVTALGSGAIWIGFIKDEGGMQAKVGGSVIAVIGIIGIVACLATD